MAPGECGTAGLPFPASLASLTKQVWLQYFFPDCCLSGAVLAVSLPYFNAVYCGIYYFTDCKDPTQTSHTARRSVQQNRISSHSSSLPQQDKAEVFVTESELLLTRMRKTLPP